MALLLILSAVHAAGLVSSRALHGNDFKHLWTGAWCLAHGMNPYDPAQLFAAAAANRVDPIHPDRPTLNPYVYLPTTGLLMRPLAWLRYGEAKVVWFWLNWALAWALVIFGPGLLRVPAPAVARLAGAAFLAAAAPFYRQMTAGQMNVVTAWLILAAGAALVARREWLLGAALALGWAWKISPALLILALLPLRRWRAAAWGVGLCAGLALLSLIAYGWEVNRTCLETIRQMGYGRSTWSQFGNDFYRDPFNQSINSLFHHLFTQNPYTTPWIALPPRVANGLTGLVSLVIVASWLAAVLGLNRRMPPADPGRPHQELRLFLAGSLAMLLLPSLMWDHYAVQSLPALLWMFGQRQTVRRWQHLILGLFVLALLAIPFNPSAPSWHSGAGIFVISIRLWPIVTLYGWLLFVSEKKSVQP